MLSLFLFTFSTLIMSGFYILIKMFKIYLLKELAVWLDDFELIYCSNVQNNVFFQLNCVVGAVELINRST